MIEVAWTVGRFAMIAGAFWFGLSPACAAVEIKSRPVGVEMKAESIVDMRPFAESPWGFWQFPVVARFSDGSVYVTFSNHKDCAALNHIPGPVFRYVSDKNVWMPEAAVSAGELAAVELPNGEWFMNLRVEGPDARKIEMPKSYAVSTNWHNNRHYDARAIAALQTRWWFFKRRARKGGRLDAWKDETGTVTIPGESRCVREDKLMYPFFLQILLAPMAKGDRPTLYAVNMDRRFTDDACSRLQSHNPALVFESLDNGHSWENVGEIPFQPDKKADPDWQHKMGFSEPWLGFAPDGSMLCFLRSAFSTPGPLYLAHSADRGRTWSKPAVFDDHGVKPKVMTLKNGVTVATYGRPGVSIALTRDPAAKQWDRPIEIIPGSGDYMNDTCGYAHLCPMGDNEFMLVYSDFRRQNASGERCKAIVAKRFKVE
jgi:hypothetical protein